MEDSEKCMFHDEKFLDKRPENKEIVRNRFIRKFKEAITDSEKKPFDCTGYFLTDVVLTGIIPINVVFIYATFKGEANFWNAEFTGEAYFRNAKFTGKADFRSAEFTGDLNFDQCKFDGIILLRHIRFPTHYDISSKNKEVTTTITNTPRIIFNSNLSHVSFYGSKISTDTSFDGHTKWREDEKLFDHHCLSISDELNWHIIWTYSSDFGLLKYHEYNEEQIKKKCEIEKKIAIKNKSELKKIGKEIKNVINLFLQKMAFN